MKRCLIAAVLVTASFSALADGLPGDCFPTCPEPKAAVVSPVAGGAGVEVAIEPIVTVAERETAPTNACGSLVARSAQQVEALNDQIKPVKELVGYIRSPQGLALKLINDHIVTISGWVGFALDPVGTIKHKAIDEVRGQVKEAMGIGAGKSCTPAAEAGPLLAEDAI